MSFVGDIFGWITSGIGAIFKTGGDIIGSINKVLDATGIATLLTTINNLTSSIDRIVNGFAEALHGIVDPITTTINGINKLAHDIQDNIVSPIITPIVTTVAEIKGLTKTIDRLVDEGIGGIIKIPGAIADALTGISGAFDRSSRILAEAQAKIVAQSLVPGMVDGLSPGLQSIAAGLIKFSDNQKLNVVDFPKIEFGGNIDVDSLSTVIARKVEEYKKQDGIAAQLMLIFLDLVSFAPLIIGFLEAQVDEARESGKAANPTATLPVDAILALYQRRIIDGGTADQELRKHGYDTERRKALFTGTAFIPSIDRAGDWLRRGLISEAEWREVLATYGVEGDQYRALKAELGPSISPAILVDWLARGIMTQKDFDDRMASQGYDANRILQFIKGAITPPRLSTAMAAKGNQIAANANFFRGTYGSSPPDDVRAAGHANREDEGEIYTAWQAHWNAMPIGTAITLFFRGELTRDEVKIVVAQNNYPPEMTDLLIQAQSTLLSPRSVPALLASGQITPAKADEILRQRGYSEADATLLIENTLRSIDAKTPADQTETTKLTLAQLRSAYLDGVIDQAAYRDLLGQHKLTGDDLEITVALADYDLLKQTKKDISDTIIAEVKLGVLTVDEAISALYDAEFSGPEVERLAVTLQNTKRQAAKVPTVATGGQLYKKGLLSQDDLLALIQANGYAEPWDQLLAALITSGGSGDGEPGQPSQPAN